MLDMGEFFDDQPLGYLLYAGDSLAGERWDERGWRTHDAREDLFWLAADVCLRL